MLTVLLMVALLIATVLSTFSIVKVRSMHKHMQAQRAKIATLEHKVHEEDVTMELMRSHYEGLLLSLRHDNKVSMDMLELATNDILAMKQRKDLLITRVHDFLNSENIFVEFPDRKEAWDKWLFDTITFLVNEG